MSIVADLDSNALLSQLMAYDLIGAFANEMGRRYIVDTHTKKMRFFNEMFAQNWDVPWIYVRGIKDACCTFYQDCAKNLGFVHSYCMNCWKTVVAPSNLVELLKLFELQKELAKDDETCACKCGIEIRDYVPRHYGGYFYSRSLELGRERAKQVREVVDKKIGPHVPVILKRYCTEFEREFGPTDTYKRPAFAKAWEEIFDAFVELPVRANEEAGFLPQSAIIQKHVLNKWCQWATKHDYKTACALNNGKPILKPLVTYHEDVREDEVRGE